MCYAYDMDEEWYFADSNPETGEPILIIEDIYDYCESMNLDIDTVIHEEGPAQLEFNFRHGDALALADQVFVFNGWTFLSSPSITLFDHPVYDIWLTKCY